MGELHVTSQQFSDGERLSQGAAHSSTGGQNVSPQLSWSGAPEETKSFAITVWDPDAPTTVGFSHWVRFDIAPTVTELAEGSGTAQGSWIDGRNDWGDLGWGGMGPPPGDPPHHYRFTVYALDTESLGVDENTGYAKLRFLIRGHVLAEGSITGLYEIAG